MKTYLGQIRRLGGTFARWRRDHGLLGSVLCCSLASGATVRIICNFHHPPVEILFRLSLQAETLRV